MAASIATPDPRVLPLATPAGPVPAVSGRTGPARRRPLLRPLAGRRAARLSLGLTLGLGVMLGCGSDTNAPPLVAPEQLYWTLRLNQHAIVMAVQPPYDTVQLIATPVSANGTPLTGLGPVTFASSDSSVGVSPTGLLRARSVPASGSFVTVTVAARDTVHGVTVQSVAYVQVTLAPGAGLATYSMQPDPGDSAKRPLQDRVGNGLFVQATEPWAVTAIDSANQTLCQKTGSCTIPVYYTSSNPRVAPIDSSQGVITKVDTGHVWLAAQTLYYGRPYRDSVNFHVGLPTIITILLTPASQTNAGGVRLGSKIVLGVGGTLLFWNQGIYGTGHITFSDSTFAAASPFFSTGSGNITFSCDSVPGQNFGQSCPPFGGGIQTRGFLQPGTVQMQVSAWGGYPVQTVELDVVRE